MRDYYRPASVDDALALLRSAENLIILAGGTDVYPQHTAQRAWGSAEQKSIIDITALTELRGIEDRGDHWWFGALTTWSDIIRAPLPPIFDGLKSAARDIGGIQIQNRGTIGGNCCTASPAGDCIPCLLALDAEFELQSATQRKSPATAFFAGYRLTALGRDELLTGIRIPKQAGRSAFRKLGARRYLVISIAMVACVIDVDDAGRVVSAKIAVGACAATAQRLRSVEAAVIGRPLDAALVMPAHFADLEPIGDIRASAAFRRHAAFELTRDVIASFAPTLGSEAING